MRDHAVVNRHDISLLVRDGNLEFLHDLQNSLFFVVRELRAVTPASVARSLMKGQLIIRLNVVPVISRRDYDLMLVDELSSKSLVSHHAAVPENDFQKVILLPFVLVA